VKGCGKLFVYKLVTYRCGDIVAQDPRDDRPPGMRACPRCYRRLMTPAVR
jgi:hypothetical protein